MEVENDLFQSSYSNSAPLPMVDCDQAKFSDYALPLCILNNCYDMVSQNLAFKKINITPQECQHLKDLDKIEKKSNIYLVRIKKIEYFNEDFYLYVFQGLDHFKDSLSKKEKEILFKNENNDLEIVTSSMAHELNNPIAGILGAVELLQLELESCIDKTAVLQDLLEIKKSAKRCKDLIEIFLGFSRNDLNFKKCKMERDITSLINETAEKSIELLRPRMFESNIYINFKFEASDVSSWQSAFPSLQPAAFTLLFYFLLNEALIYISHQRLVLQIPIEQRDVFDWKIKLQHKTDGQEEQFIFTIFYDSSKETFKRLCDSKLFQYLLKKINLSLPSIYQNDSNEKNNLTFFMKI